MIPVESESTCGLADAGFVRQECKGEADCERKEMAKDVCIGEVTCPKEVKAFLKVPLSPALPLPRISTPRADALRAGGQCGFVGPWRDLGGGCVCVVEHTAVQWRCVHGACAQHVTQGATRDSGRNT